MAGARLDGVDEGEGGEREERCVAVVGDGQEEDDEEERSTEEEQPRLLVAQPPHKQQRSIKPPHTLHRRLNSLLHSRDVKGTTGATERL